jgi:hypothetical protein
LKENVQNQVVTRYIVTHTFQNRITETSSGNDRPDSPLRTVDYFSCTVHDEPKLTSQKGAAAGSQNKQLHHSQQVLWQQLLLSRTNLKMALNSVIQRKKELQPNTNVW